MGPEGFPSRCDLAPWKPWPRGKGLVKQMEQLTPLP